jgi:hypothetical protein
MIRSEVERRSKRYAPRQCVSDYGMHKDAPPKKCEGKSILAAELERWLAASKSEVRS